MAIGYSNKVIFISERTRIATPIKIALNKLGFEFATDYPALSSIPLIRKGIARTGRTAFIRTELLRFIKEKGFPRGIIMDSRIELGLDPALDAGGIKLLKTMIITYIILSKGADCRSLRGNFILLTKGDSFEKEFGLGADPHGVVKLLSTQNPEINFFIEELKGNRARFDEMFSIKLLDAELSSDAIIESVAGMLAFPQESAPAASKEEAGPPKAAGEPAKEEEGAPGAGAN